MSFDERALLIEQAHRSLAAPRRSAWRDGPAWWLGPIAIFAALALALAAIPWPKARPEPAAKAPSAEADVVASRSAWYSKN